MVNFAIFQQKSLSDSEVSIIKAVQENLPKNIYFQILIFCNFVRPETLK